MPLDRRFLCIGPIWRGSNAGGIFRALSRIGCHLSVIDEFYYIPLFNKAFTTRFLSKIFRSLFIKEFNKAILDEIKIFRPTILFVYKGAFILPETLREIKKEGIPCVNFYPDVSFHTHGQYLLQTLPIYNHIFTTKTFGIFDLDNQLGIKNVSFVPHGFDPEIHKKIEIIDPVFKCDVSFIGTWSLQKEKLIASLIRSLPDIIIKIWGSQWDRTTDEQLISSNAIQRYPITGDIYALAINNSRINLGLVSEKVRGASSGDKITSRTFHIPGANGFMLHERTDEISNYFVEGEEIACFEGEDELIEKVKYYLSEETERKSIKEKGYKRALNDHSLDQRAQTILNLLDEVL